MVEIQNTTKEKIPLRTLQSKAELVLSKEKARGKDVSIVLVTQRKSLQLNRRYRGKDRPANVLAFSGGKEALGEVVLCPSVIKKDALQYKISFLDTLSVMLVHGLLHLLGHDHKTLQQERKMKAKETLYQLLTG